MPATPFLSIVIPVYNAEKYLACCLDSILAQDYSDYEVILVDDGSTDRCPSLCDAYAAADPRIHCLHQPNSGHTAARQNGVKASRGQYIAFVDSDDWVSPEMYRRMCTAAKDTHADLIHCNFTAVMPDKEKLCDIPFPAGFYDKTQLIETVYPNMIYFGTYFGVSFWNGICSVFPTILSSEKTDLSLMHVCWKPKAYTSVRRPSTITEVMPTPSATIWTADVLQRIIQCLKPTAGSSIPPDTRLFKNSCNISSYTKVC